MNTVPNPSRLPIDRLSNLPSAHTFGELSNYLRGAIAGEDSRLFSESMCEVARHSETVVAALRLSRRREAVAPVLMDMLTVLRDHRALVVNLGLAWRGLYEYAAYLQALNSFRVVIGEWLLGRSGWDGDDLDVSAEEFDRLSWRTMGEGMLLSDMYEQWLRRELHESEVETLQEPQPEGLRQWWHRLRR